ncbi:6-phosphogluconolactonase [Myxosarcina sp. GI1(2024)]
MKKFVETLPDKASLIDRCLEVVSTKLRAAIAAKGRCTIALAGGSTPKPLYEALATQSLPWEQVHVFWGDERYVASTHNNSNQLMARQAWLERVDFPATNIHPMPTAAGDPQEDARKYEAELQDFFQTDSGEFPVFDLILLGMGDDGHTASLFPHTEVLKVSDRAIALGDKGGEPRLTFTVPLINQADCVLFIVSGENKRFALQQVFAAEADAMHYPSRLIRPQGELWWLLDKSAGMALAEN